MIKGSDSGGWGLRTPAPEQGGHLARPHRRGPAAVGAGDLGDPTEAGGVARVKPGWSRWETEAGVLSRDGEESWPGPGCGVMAKDRGPVGALH